LQNAVGFPCGEETRRPIILRKKEVGFELMLAQVGKPAPDFKLGSTKDATGAKDLGKQIRLSDYKGKWLVFFFYPLDFTFVCPTEITALSDRLPEFQEFDTEILGCSTDSVFSHWAWLNTPREKNGIAGTNYPLVADFTKETARAYGVLDENSGVAQRGLFIIDPEGTLKYAVVTADNIGRSVEETLRVLQALQTGGLCPAEWKPGKALLTV
jgi:peroxiredoxin 2/4